MLRKSMVGVAAIVGLLVAGAGSALADHHGGFGGHGHHGGYGHRGSGYGHGGYGGYGYGRPIVVAPRPVFVPPRPVVIQQPYPVYGGGYGGGYGAGGCNSGYGAGYQTYGIGSQYGTAFSYSTPGFGLYLSR